AKKENNKEKSNVPNTKEGLKNLKNVRPYSALENSENDIETSISFENNKGKLPWPVDKGNVDVHFGISTIPDTKLTRKSDGIEISVPKGSAVKNVANGKVTSVGELNGEKFVMIFHGKYISVYRHLSNVYVKVNQEIKGRTLIGTSGIGIDGEGTLLFMIANDKGEPLNPEIWLKKQP
ncbi:MAG: peptidoglycan DD-metalloendopeptidase family protein, partial [Sediminibacterium sp.]|nr:peptidoglycan DD-metalloendopeptidase family protein [Sediminibacterium sp.]